MTKYGIFEIPFIFQHINLMYQSPIHIIPSYDLTRINPTSLKRLRKELTLRFELKQTTQIELNNYLFDKETLFKQLAELSKNGAFHQQIFQNKPLLQFLEKGKVMLFLDGQLSTYFEDADFVEFLQPHFSAQLNQLIYQLVSNKKYDNLKILQQVLAQQENTPSSYWEQAFIKTRQHLLSVNQQLQSLHDTNEITKTKLSWTVGTKAFNKVFHSTYLRKLNLLPIDLEGILLELADIVLVIVRKILGTGELTSLKIDKNLLLDIQAMLTFAHQRMQKQAILDVKETIDKLLKNPIYNVLEMGSLFFRSIR